MQLLKKSKPRTFINIGVIQPSGLGMVNLNENGRIKTARFGDDDIRQYVSSQSQQTVVNREVIELKEESLKGIVDYNSRRHGRWMSERMIKQIEGFSISTLTDLCLLFLTEIFKDVKNMTRISNKEKDILIDMFLKEYATNKNIQNDMLAVEKSQTEDKKKTFTKKHYDKLLKEMQKALKDIPGGIISSLTGRMFASAPSKNVKAVAYKTAAFTVHSIAPFENRDDFTAMEQICFDDSDTGAGHMDTRFLGRGVFFKNYVIDATELMDSNHLAAHFDFSDAEEREACTGILKVVLKSYVSAFPMGKQNSLLSRLFPVIATSHIVKGCSPFSLSGAFLRPLKQDDNIYNNALDRIVNEIKKHEQWMTVENPQIWTTDEVDVSKYKNEYTCIDKIDNWVNNLIPYFKFEE
jgi:hypothetical protein